MAKVKVIRVFLDKKHNMERREFDTEFFCGDDRAGELAGKGFVKILKTDAQEKKTVPAADKEKKEVEVKDEKKEIKKP